MTNIKTVDIPLMPIMGMNNVAEDAAMHRAGDDPRLFVRDAVNVAITPAGKALVRAPDRRVCAVPYRGVWQSALHGDVFGTLDGQWVKINPADWSHEVLAEIGAGAVHVALGSLVCAAGPNGVFTYDGARAMRLTLDTPAAPMLQVETGAGALQPGAYGVALAWLRGSRESATSAMASVDVNAPGGADALEIVPPLCLDDSVTGLRLYLTRPNGGELLRAGDWPIGTVSIRLPLLPTLGAPAPFRHLSPMPTGRFLAYWRGRLLTARANVMGSAISVLGWVR